MNRMKRKKIKKLKKKNNNSRVNKGIATLVVSTVVTCSPVVISHYQSYADEVGNNKIQGEDRSVAENIEIDNKAGAQVVGNEKSEPRENNYHGNSKDTSNNLKVQTEEKIGEKEYSSQDNSALSQNTDTESNTKSKGNIEIKNYKQKADILTEEKSDTSNNKVKSVNSYYVNTYEFYNGTNKIEKDTQILTNGDRLVEPEIPKKRNKNERFIGWFRENDQNEKVKFNGFGVVNDVNESNNNSIIKLYAKFEEGLYIKYHDDFNFSKNSKSNGEPKYNNIKTIYIEPDQDVVISKNSPMFLSHDDEINAGIKHVGWRTENGTEDISGKYSFSREHDVKDINLLKEKNEDDDDSNIINLYPIIKHGYWIQYNTNGGETAIMDSFVENDSNNVKLPQKVLKKGYSFNGWYFDKETKNSVENINVINNYFNNNSGLKKITLYAGWNELKEVKYLVNYYIKYQKDTTKNDDSAWDYKLVLSSEKKGTPNEFSKKNYNGKESYAKYNLRDIFQNENDGYKYVVNKEKTLIPEINASGDTVLNVYLDPVEVKYIFSGRNRDNNPSNGQYLNSDGELYKREFTLKYGQNTKFVFDALEKDGILQYMKDNTTKEHLMNFFDPFHSQDQVEPKYEDMPIADRFNYTKINDIEAEKSKTGNDRNYKFEEITDENGKKHINVWKYIKNGDKVDEDRVRLLGVYRPNEKIVVEDMNYFILKVGGYNSYANYYKEALNGEVPEGKELVSNISLRKNKDKRKYYLDRTLKGNTYAYGAEIFDSESSTYPGFTLRKELSDGYYGYLPSGKIGIWYRYHEGWNKLSEKSIKEYKETYKNEEEFKKVIEKITNKYLKGMDPLYNDENQGPVNYWFEKPGVNTDGKGNKTEFRYQGALNIYFTRNKYKLKFDHVVGEIPLYKDSEKPSEYEVSYEDNLSKYLPDNYEKDKTKIIDKDGKELIFKGWFDSNGIEINKDSKMPSKNLNINAKWEPTKYTVKINLNNGKDIITKNNISYGSQIEEPKEIKNKDRIFLGWTIDGEPFNFESPINKDIEIKAIWKSVNSYKVNYDLNGANGEKITDDETYYENTGVIAKGINNIISPEGKYFVGWKVKGSEDIYYPGELILMANGDMKLIATWDDLDNTSSLKYDLGYSHYGIDRKDNVAVEDNILKNSKIALKDFTNFGTVPEGYEFKGWYLDSERTDGPYTEAIINNKGENIVYAKFEKKPVPPESNSYHGVGKNSTENDNTKDNTTTKPEEEKNEQRESSSEKQGNNVVEKEKQENKDEKQKENKEIKTPEKTNNKTEKIPENTRETGKLAKTGENSTIPNFLIGALSILGGLSLFRGKNRKKN